MRHLLPCLGLLGLLTAAPGCAGPAGAGQALAPASPTVPDAASPEAKALAQGHVVTKPLEFERDGHDYVGGVATGLVPAAPADVLLALDDAAAIVRMLPRTKQARFVDGSGPVRRLELVQGNSIVEARYTVEITPSATPGTLEFRLDRTRPHDIDDVYGYFKVERFDDTRSAVTVAAAVDVGSGLTYMLFGKRVQDVILSAPYSMRDYFAEGGPADGTALVAHNESR